MKLKQPHSNKIIYELNIHSIHVPHVADSKIKMAGKDEARLSAIHVIEQLIFMKENGLHDSCRILVT